MSEQLPENQPWWTDFIEARDDATLKELAERFGVTPSVIAAAMVRTQTSRRPCWSDEAESQRGKPKRPSQLARPGSKDSRIQEIRDKLGQVPDRVAAEIAGVSQRTITSFRKRHGIDAFQGRGRPRSKSVPTKRSRATRSDGPSYAWRVAFDDGTEGVVTASSAADASYDAESKGGVVVGLERMGKLL